MTPGDLLIGLFALAAWAVLFVGLAQALDGRPVPRRRSSPALPEPLVSPHLGRVAVPGPGGNGSEPAAGLQRRSRPGGPAARRPVQLPLLGSLVDEAAPGVGGPSAPPGPTDLERCLALCQEGRHAEATVLAESALEGSAEGRSPPLDPPARAVLEALRGLGCLSREDRREATARYEAGLSALAGVGAAGGDRGVLRLSALVARQLLARALEEGPWAEERASALRLTAALADRAARAWPDDPGVAQIATLARDCLWTGVEGEIRALLRARRFPAAEAVLRRGLAGDELPPARRTAWRDLLTAAVGGEVGVLTARALGTGERDPLVLLEAAEEALARLPAAATAGERGADLRRRLWAACFSLGRRRLEAGAVEEAVELLMRAWPLAGADDALRVESRPALLAALRAMADRAGIGMVTAAGAGQLDRAGAAVDRLAAAVDRALGLGVERGDLEGLIDRAAHRGARLRVENGA